MTTQPIRQWLSIVLASVLLLTPLLTVGASASPTARSSQTPVAAPTREPSLRQAVVVSLPNHQGKSLLFIQNVGQFPDSVRFQVRGGAGTMWLADDALWISISEQRSAGTEEPESRGAEEQGRQGDKEKGRKGKGVNLKLSFPGANPQPRLEPFDRLKTVINYYHGNDPAHWYANVPVWGGVRYVDLYPGVNLEIAGGDGGWAWQLITQRATRSTSAVRLRVEGADDVALADGYLRLATVAGDLALPLLTVSDTTFTDQPTVQHTAPETFSVTSPFASPATPHASRITNHAPQDNPGDLLFGTFLGADNDDEAYALAVNGDGAIYVTGYTRSSGFPTTPGAYDSSLTGNEDVFVTKLNAAGNDLVYSTFIGGGETAQNPQVERGYDIAVDGSGAAYVSGGTTAANFPTTSGAFDTTAAGFDTVVVKLGSSGELAYSTYVSGASVNENAIAVDGSGMVYVTGLASEDLPTTAGAYDRSYGYSWDFFVLKLNPAGQGSNDLLYGTYVGMDAQDYATDIAVDGAGVVYVTGYTEGAFPTTSGAYDTAFNGALPCQAAFCPRNVVFFKLNPAGNGAADLLYSTYLGGAATINERGEGIAVDAAGIVYLTGSTWAPDFPTTPGAFDTTHDGNFGDVFVSRLDPAGNSAADLLYSTFLGGTYIDNGGRAITVDDAGDIYVIGDTYSSDFPTTLDAFQSTRQGYTDLFVTRLRLQGAGQADLVYSTYLGGNRPDYGRGIAVGQGETVYVTGSTGSSDWPTTAGAYDTTFGGGTCGSYPCDDAFVARLRVVPRYTIAGRVLDGSGSPIKDVRISASGTYSATTNASGVYTITDVLSGTYTLTPAPGYFWSPASRSVTVPPDVTGQDFSGRNIVKQVTPSGPYAVGYGEPLTYTLRLVQPDNRTLVLYDPVPTYTAYISGSLSASSLAYYTASNAISGTLTLSATVLTTVTFTVQVEVTGTITTPHLIRNRACIYPPGGGPVDCEWSNQVINYSYVWPVYLPVVFRDFP